jgi:hypothetical protein
MLDATERKALTLSTFAAACLCFAPGQVVSGAFLLVVSILLWRWDQKHLAREAQAAENASKQAKADAS